MLVVDTNVWSIIKVKAMTGKTGPAFGSRNGDDVERENLKRFAE